MALALFANCPTAKAECSLAAVAVLPLEKDHGRYLLDADVNGHPVKLILATGYYATALDLKAADDLGVSMGDTGRLIYGVGGTQRQYRGFVSRLRIGNIKADGALLIGADMWGNDPAPKWSGRFGMSMMSIYDIDLDFAGSHAILYDAHGNCTKPNVALQPNLFAVPLEPVHENRQADIMVVVDGHPIKAMLDSGAPHTIMYRAAAERLGVDLSPLHAPGHETIVGLGKYPIGVMDHHFGSVAFGDLTIQNMAVRIVDQRTNGVDRHRTGSLLDTTVYDALNGEEMLIGADFMQKVHLWISHSSQTLIMQYPPLPSVLPK
jgi:hypothetical protein